MHLCAYVYMHIYLSPKGAFKRLQSSPNYICTSRIPCEFVGRVGVLKDFWARAIVNV